MPVEEVKIVSVGFGTLVYHTETLHIKINIFL